MAGKGSRQRPTDTSKYHANWDAIWASKKDANRADNKVVISHEPGMSTECIDCPEDRRGRTK